MTGQSSRYPFRQFLSIPRVGDSAGFLRIREVAAFDQHRWPVLPPQHTQKPGASNGPVGSSRHGEQGLMHLQGAGQVLAIESIVGK
jgi:hypothetical protein